MNREAELELRHLDIGMKEKMSKLFEGEGLHIPSLTKFVNNKFRAWPGKLSECESYARELDAALTTAKAQFYLKLSEKDRREALLRVAIWQAWENKYQNCDFSDMNCGIIVTGIKRHKALEEKSMHAIGHIINHLAKGDLSLEDVSIDRIWKTFATFMGEMKDAYLLEPLRRKGLLGSDAEAPKRIEAQEQKAEAA